MVVRAAGFVLGIALLLPGDGRATPSAVNEAEGPRSYSQRAFTKIRPGSMLKSDAPPPEPADLRGELEHRRDSELIKHYTRMAQLDIIADIAEKVHHIDLQEKVEEVRRKEEQRFHNAMQDLRQVVWRRVVAESP